MLAFFSLAMLQFGLFRWEQCQIEKAFLRKQCFKCFKNVVEPKLCWAKSFTKLSVDHSLLLREPLCSSLPMILELKPVLLVTFLRKHYSVDILLSSVVCSVLADGWSCLSRQCTLEVYVGTVFNFSIAFFHAKPLVHEPIVLEEVQEFHSNANHFWHSEVCFITMPFMGLRTTSSVHFHSTSNTKNQVSSEKKPQQQTTAADLLTHRDWRIPVWGSAAGRLFDLVFVGKNVATTTQKTSSCIFQFCETLSTLIGHLKLQNFLLASELPNFAEHTQICLQEHPNFLVQPPENVFTWNSGTHRPSIEICEFSRVNCWHVSARKFYFPLRLPGWWNPIQRAPFCPHLPQKIPTLLYGSYLATHLCRPGHRPASDREQPVHTFCNTRNSKQNSSWIQKGADHKISFVLHTPSKMRCSRKKTHLHIASHTLETNNQLRRHVVRCTVQAKHGTLCSCQLQRDQWRWRTSAHPLVPLFLILRTNVDPTDMWQVIVFVISTLMSAKMTVPQQVMWPQSCIPKWFAKSCAAAFPSKLCEYLVRPSDARCCSIEWPVNREKMCVLHQDQNESSPFQERKTQTTTAAIHSFMIVLRQRKVWCGRQPEETLDSGHWDTLMWGIIVPLQDLVMQACKVAWSTNRSRNLVRLNVHGAQSLHAHNAAVPSAKSTELRNPNCREKSTSL